MSDYDDPLWTAMFPLWLLDQTQNYRHLHDRAAAHPLARTMLEQLIHVNERLAHTYQRLNRRYQVADSVARIADSKAELEETRRLVEETRSIIEASVALMDTRLANLSQPQIETRRRNVARWRSPADSIVLAAIRSGRYPHTVPHVVPSAKNRHEKLKS